MNTNNLFTKKKITENILRIEGILHEYMYLITGQERALLIDTGCGAGNVKDYVHSLTQLPLTVMLTHGHFDHMGGSSRFDEVYIGEKEAEYTPIHYDAKQVWEELDESNIHISFEIMTKIKPVKYRWLHDGMVFDLGGTTAECILCPGHTAETYAVLLKAERLLMIGDACHSITYLFLENSLSVSDYKAQLEQLKRREAEWDSLLLSHPVGIAPKKMLDEVLHVCDIILMGKSSSIPFNFRGNYGMIARPTDENMLRADGKLGNIIYNPKNIFTEKQKNPHK